MKTIFYIKAGILSLLFLAGALLPAHSEILFSDSFQGTGIDTNHWTIKGQNATGWATVTENYLEINGGPLSPDNNYQGWFLQGKDGWTASEQSHTSLTLLPPNITTQSGSGVQSLTSWLWISDGTPTSASAVLSTNLHFLVKVNQGIGERDYNQVEIYSKQTSGTGEGTLLWSGRYSILDDPSLTINITLTQSSYSVEFNQDMFNTSGALSGDHGINFTETLYANLGGANGGVGRGETRFVDFSLATVPEPTSLTFLIGGGALMLFLHRRHRRQANRH